MEPQAVLRCLNTWRFLRSLPKLSNLGFSRAAIYDIRMSSRLLWRIVVAVSIVGFSNSLHARVAPADFSTLVRKADLAVLGKVIGVATINGVRVASVKVLQTYKGRRLDVLSFVAQPT